MTQSNNVKYVFCIWHIGIAKVYKSMFSFAPIDLKPCAHYTCAEILDLRRHDGLHVATAVAADLGVDLGGHGHGVRLIQ